MRITQLMTFNTMTRYLNDNREELAKYQQQLSSGKAVTKASDDGIAFTNSRLLEKAISKNEQFQNNIASGLTKARYAQDALDGMMVVLIDFKSITVNAATDTVSTQDRENLADQMLNLKEQVVDLANTEFNGSYLFAGTKSDAPPFSIDPAAAGGVNYEGNGKQTKTQISETTELTHSITGTELRNTDAGDLFDIMQNMEDALRADDTAAINNNLDAVNTALDHVTNVTSILGNNINRMDFLGEKLQGQVIDQKGEVSRLVDTDFAEAISNVQKSETTYQAALSVHSRLIQTSLLDFI